MVASRKFREWVAFEFSSPRKHGTERHSQSFRRILARQVLGEVLQMSPRKQGSGGHWRRQGEYRGSHKQSVPDTDGDREGAAAGGVPAARAGFAVGKRSGGATGLHQPYEIDFPINFIDDRGCFVHTKFNGAGVPETRAGPGVGERVSGANRLHADPAIDAAGTHGARPSSSSRKRRDIRIVRHPDFERIEHSQPAHQHGNGGSIGLRQCGADRANGRSIVALGSSVVPVTKGALPTFPPVAWQYNQRCSSRTLTTGEEVQPCSGLFSLFC